MTATCTKCGELKWGPGLSLDFQCSDCIKQEIGISGGANNIGFAGDVIGDCTKCGKHNWGPQRKKGESFVCNKCVASRKAACRSVGSVPKSPHWDKLAIDPYEYAHRNGLGMLQGNVVKYVTRYKDKNGKEDLEKAMNTLQRLIDLEYPK